MLSNLGVSEHMKFQDILKTYVLGNLFHLKFLSEFLLLFWIELKRELKDSPAAINIVLYNI